MLARMLRYLLLGQILAGSLIGWCRSLRCCCPSSPCDWVCSPAPYSPAALVTLPFGGARWWGKFGSLQRSCFSRCRGRRARPPCRCHWLPPDRIPVLLVHGFVCNHRIWDAMANQLRRAGHPILGINLEPVFGSIDGYTPLIEDAVESLRHQTGAQKIAVIAHSMGGLATRAWMREYGTARVARVLTLGTPHVGTRLATWSHTANGRQMRWHSPWLQELARGEPAANLQLIRIALTPQDNIVYPHREQVLPGVPVTVFEGRGHIQLCFDTAVIKWVVQQLEGLPGISPEQATGTWRRPKANGNPFSRTV